MYLKKAFWNEAPKSETQSGDKLSETTSPVTDLVSSLDDQRLYREVTLALRTGLRDARSDFSFLRLHGLRNILKFLRSVAASDSTINLFCHTQTIPDLQGTLCHFTSAYFIIRIIYIQIRTLEIKNLFRVCIFSSCLTTTSYFLSCFTSVRTISFVYQNYLFL